MKEILSLTSLRYFAALWVYLVHFFPYLHPNVSPQFRVIVQEGYLGVTVFFALSGFLLTIRYWDMFSNKKITRQVMWDYIRKRIARIYPLYLFLILLSGVIPVNQVGIHLWTLTQSYFYDMRIAALPTAWTLTLEEAFYFILPLFLMFTVPCYERIKHRFGVHFANTYKVIVWGIVIYCMGLFVVFISNIMGMSQHYGFMRDVEFMTTLTIFGRFIDFGIGIIGGFIYLNHRKWFDESSYRVVWLMVSIFSLIGLYVVSSITNIVPDDLIVVHWILNVGVAIISTVLILSLSNPYNLISRLMSLPSFVYLGRVSFALYLAQSLFIFYPYWTMRMTYDNMVSDTAIANFFVIYIVIQVFSMALYEFIEKRGRDIVLRLTRNERLNYEPESITVLYKN